MTSRDSTDSKDLWADLLRSWNWLQLAGGATPSTPELERLFDPYDAKFLESVLTSAEQFMQDVELFGSILDKTILKERVVLSLDAHDYVEKDLIDWILFWSQQFKEHVAYLDLLLSRLPKEAFSPASPLSSNVIINQPQIAPDDKANLHFAADLVDALKSTALPIVKEWDEFQKSILKTIDGRNYTLYGDDLFDLCRATMMFKFQIYQAHKNGLWTGSVFLGVIEHHIEELLMFMLRLSGQANESQLRCYFVQMIAEHTSVTAHSITPGGPKPIRNIVLQNLSKAEEGFFILEEVKDILQPRPRDLDDLDYSEFWQSTVDYTFSASAMFEKQFDDLVNQDIPNITVPIDQYHILREHNFAKQKIEEMI